MRDFKGMKRQRNRNRGGGGGGGGGKPQHNANRAFDSNGPDGVKVRGAAQHIYEKYQQLARDAGSGGDRVLAENYLQHAEHYFRVLRAMQPQRPVGEIIGRDNVASGNDIDFEEEPQAGDQGEAADAEADGGREDRPWARDDRQRDESRPRDDRQRDDRPRDERQRDDFRSRDDRPRDDNRQRDDFRPREDRFRDQPRYNRDDRPRDDRPRDDRQARYRDDRPRNDRDARPERDPLGVVEPQATPLTAAAPAPAYEAPEPSHGVLRSEDGGVSQAPAFLQPRASEPRPADADAEEAAGEARRPRRRRAPRTFEASEGAAPAEVDEG